LSIGESLNLYFFTVFDHGGRQCMDMPLPTLFC
jgi:hypothetical protein